MFDIDNDALVAAAEEALTRPGNFGYFGDMDLFGSWGLTGVGVHHDSDTLDRSNYRSIVRDLTTRLESNDLDPANHLVEIHCGHWAHGWVDHLAVRVLINPDGEVTPDNITGVFRWIAAVTTFLTEQYPVYDEMDLSEMESEAQRDMWNAGLSSDILSFLEKVITFAPPRGARDRMGRPYSHVEDYVSDAFLTSESAFRDAYYRYDGNEWVPDGGGFYNANHGAAVVYAAASTFGWSVPVSAA